MTRMIQDPYDSVIVRKGAGLLVPVVQFFAVYVLVFGQFGPGGGFVAGVMLAASFTIGILANGREGSSSGRARKMLAGDGAGLLLFVFIGGLCLIGGGEFLNYSSAPLPGIDSAWRRHIGILLTQVGVALDVAVAAVSIVFSLSEGAVRGVGDD